MTSLLDKFVQGGFSFNYSACTFDHVSMPHSAVFMVCRYTMISKRRTKMHTEWSVGLRFSHNGAKVALRVRRLKNLLLV